MGWASITGQIDTSSVILYLAGIFWTLGYDTIYAHQDKEDDALIGIKSSALALKSSTKLFIYIVYTITIFGIFLIGWINGFSILFYLFMLIAFCQLIWQIRTVDLDNPRECLSKFKSNRLFGFLITFAIFIG
jgi:4-hydroxybenzoate polyprenyltransferase